MGIIILVVVLVLLVVWAISTQNSLVHADELCGNALSQIGVQQESRWDALSALADLTKGYSEHEYKTLVDIISARKKIGEKSTAVEAQEQENMLDQAFGRINALAEAYPDLKSNTVYLKTMDSVNSYENNVRMSRMVYNDSVTKFNRIVRAFPGSVIAGFLKFDTREYLQESNKSEMPSMK